MGYRAAARVHVAAERMAAGLRGRGGQGTVEYVALILLVAVVLAGVVVATRKSSIGDGGIGRTIVERLKGALDQVR
jgi:hypothetical protein